MALYKLNGFSLLPFSVHVNETFVGQIKEIWVATFFCICARLTKEYTAVDYCMHEKSSWLFVWGWRPWLHLEVAWAWCNGYWDQHMGWACGVRSIDLVGQLVDDVWLSLLIVAEKRSKHFLLWAATKYAFLSFSWQRTDTKRICMSLWTCII